MHAPRNDGWIVVYRKCHGALKAMRSRDEHAKTAIEPVSGDPGFVRSPGVCATGDNGRLDALATVAGDPFDIEDSERHTPRL